MNKLALVFFVLAAALMTGCQDEFEKIYDLRVDAHEYTLSADGGEYHMYVYCSGEWTAAFESEQDWITIVPGTAHGAGTGLIRFETQYNDKELRSVVLVITSGQYKQTVNISQEYDPINWEIQ